MAEHAIPAIEGARVSLRTKGGGQNSLVPFLECTKTTLTFYDRVQTRPPRAGGVRRRPPTGLILARFTIETLDLRQSRSGTTGSRPTTTLFARPSMVSGLLLKSATPRTRRRLEVVLYLPLVARRSRHSRVRSRTSSITLRLAPTANSPPSARATSNCLGIELILFSIPCVASITKLKETK